MTSFNDFNLAAPIVRALADEQYVTPTPIQRDAIPAVLAGRDLIGIAQTGTGKTAAFALPILDHLVNKPRQPERKSCRVLVLSPTRELANQIADSFRTYGRHLRIGVAVAIGGVSMGGQVRALLGGVDVLVATPGRLLDLVQSHALRLDAVEVLVLDEADRMLDMGFILDIRKIVAKLPKQRQTLFFSATMPAAIADLAGHMLRDPAKVTVSPVASTVERVTQRVIHVQRTVKPALLAETLRGETIDRALVFTRTKRGADKVVRALATAGIAAEAIHGNKSQGQRERVLANFRAGKVRTLIATDIAARGIDVDGISHVVNYDLPNEPESYVHRIGRTARAGAEGVAISFCDHEEVPYLRAIEKLIRLAIPSTTDHRRASPRPAEHAPRPAQHAGRPTQHAGRPTQHSGRSTQHSGRSTQNQPARAAEHHAAAPAGKRRRRRGGAGGQGPARPAPARAESVRSEQRHDPSDFTTMPFLRPTTRGQDDQRPIS